MKENSKKGKRKRETKNGWPCEVFETVLNFTNAWNRLRPSNTTNQSDTHVQVSNYVIQGIVCNLITEGHGRYSTDMNPK